MHKIIKSHRLFSCDASEPYCFPDIFNGTVLTDSSVSEEPRTSFQRVYINVDTSQCGEPGKFRKAGDEERLENQKTMDEMILKYQKKEADAYQKGFRDGHQAGAADKAKEFETVLMTLERAIQEVKKLCKELCLKAEKQTVSLSLAVARKILLQEPAIHPEVIVGVVKKAFETIAMNTPVRIRINPMDLAYLQERRQLIPVKGEVAFIEDAAISCGGCVIESLSGDVDARIESQLQMVEEAFMPGLEKNNLELQKLS